MIDSKESHGKCPLHLAARAGQLALVQFLIKAGAAKEAEDNQGSRPLHLAAIGPRGTNLNSGCRRDWRAGCCGVPDQSRL